MGEHRFRQSKRHRFGVVPSRQRRFGSIEAPMQYRLEKPLPASALHYSLRRHYRCPLAIRMSFPTSYGVIWCECNPLHSWIQMEPLNELYSKNNRSSSKSKHIDSKFLVVKERVQSLQVSIEHISTNSMIADPLTKGLPPKVYNEHVTYMGVVHIDDVLV
uniref:Uncharacterized protein n=1 Tax=Vitis vinifera TaxID=29760 RepID=A5BYC7_VITVI|nr:hypothetical protein VITISV_011954 [Vitis vinifera]